MILDAARIRELHEIEPDRLWQLIGRRVVDPADLGPDHLKLLSPSRLEELISADRLQARWHVGGVEDASALEALKNAASCRVARVVDRRRIWSVDAEPAMLAFARWCALRVRKHREAKLDVDEWLRTGDPSLRASAWASARDSASAWDSAWAEQSVQLAAMLIECAEGRTEWIFDLAEFPAEGEA